MARFVRSGDEVVDNDTNLVWQLAPTAKVGWDDLAPPSGLSVPTLEEMKTLIDGQKQVPEDFAAAFGDNAPVDWYWVWKIDPAKQAAWDASGKSVEDAVKYSLEKPGHVAVWSNWAGNAPVNRRLLEALCRYVER